MIDDIQNLREFYKSPLGQTARRIIAHRIRARWPNVARMDVIGLGYASPYLRMFQNEARVTAALMPEQQGVSRWPKDGRCRTALIPEARLPLRDMSVECVLAVHGLEHVEARQAYMREIWRVLMPQGRVILVVPNRRGPWARFETTPFGHGRPYSQGQLEKLLKGTMLQHAGCSPCLFLPPFQFRAIRPAALAWERIGLRLWPALSGVLIVEAIKQVYAGVRVTVKKPMFAPMPALPSLQPARRSGATPMVENASTGVEQPDGVVSLEKN